MSSSDVRSILDLPQASSSNNIPTRKLAALKRPDGISRELYALIGDNAPSLADVQASISAVKYRDRPKPKGLKSRWSDSTSVHILISGIVSISPLPPVSIIPSV